MTKQFKQGNPHSERYDYYNPLDTYINKWCPQCNYGQLYVNDTGQGVEQGKRSLAFALLWQHPTRTLEIGRAHV